MGLILCIETATTVCSVALAEDGKLIALKEINSGYTTGENLTVFIEDAMREAGIKMPALGAVAVSMGPGSYTGLRIGVSTAKGICYGLGKPLIAVPTLLSFAKTLLSKPEHRPLITDYRLPITDYLLCPMIDARRMEVYCGLYHSDLKEVEKVQAKIMDAHSFENYLESQVIYFFGDGAGKCKEFLGGNPNARFLNDIFPSAAGMILFAEDAYQKGQFEDVAYFEPYYLKDFLAGPKKKTL